jgi:uncharacterized protein (DUF849 family)
MSLDDKVIITCALNGVLTNPKTHPVPYTPEEMATSSREAYEAGAAIVHIHFRDQASGRMPSWDPDLAEEIVDAIREEAPELIINMTTGVVGSDISGPVACMERTAPEMAAMNSGSLNYLRTRRSGEWAWPPMLFDNPVDKIEGFLGAMREHGVMPECECFDTGIVRSLSMFLSTGVLEPPFSVSLVQGVASGMPARTDLLPILVDLLPEEANHWQSIVIGREEVWEVHRKTAELGGHLRVGVEDTFYLPDGEKVDGNGTLVAAMADMAREVGREPASTEEARAILGLDDA